MVAHRFCIAITVLGLACVLLGVDAAAEKQPKIDLQVGDIAPLFTGLFQRFVEPVRGEPVPIHAHTVPSTLHRI